MTEEKKEEEPFDQAMQKLESILDELESGELPLEKTVERFESGMELVRQLGRRLDDMETRIRKLVEKEGGEFSLEPLEPAGDNEV